MTANKPDLSDLIKRNQQLEKENAELRQELARLTLLAHDKADELIFAATNPETFGIGTFEEIASALANIEENSLIISQAPAAAPEAPKPKFQVGDRVRVVGSASYNADSPFDTIASIEGNCYHINYLNIKTVSAFIYCEDELEPYSE